MRCDVLMLETCRYSAQLINRLKELAQDNQIDFEQVNKAVSWAKKYHGKQKRKSGEPYYTHPLEVAYIVSKYSPKTDVIVSAILHDIVEDTEITVGIIIDNFGNRIAEMVDRLTRDRPDRTKLSVEQILANAYHFQDKEVILIKLVDRIHNMQTINAKSLDKQLKTTNETFDLFIVYSIYINNKEIEQILYQLYSKLLGIKKSIEIIKKSYLHNSKVASTHQFVSQVFENAIHQSKN